MSRSTSSQARVSLFVVAALTALILAPIASRSAALKPTIKVSGELGHDRSQPLRSIKNIPSLPRNHALVEHQPSLPAVPRPHALPALNTSTLTTSVPATTATCQGTGNTDSVLPPDTSIAVGSTQVVEAVNDHIQVFDKACHATAASKTFAALWTGFVGPHCTAASRYSDPVDLWDTLANRWVLEIIDVSNNDLCIAISTSADATGTYNRYDFADALGGALPDYAKMGVWPDAYYMTTDEFAGGTTYSGPAFCAYKRAAMLAGAAATRQCSLPAQVVPNGSPSNYIAAMPASLDGATPPPSGSPEWFVAQDPTLDANGNNTALSYWKMHIDWSNGALSSLTGPTRLPVTPYVPACSFYSPAPGAINECVLTPPPGSPLDALGLNMMYRLAYRNFGDHQALVASHAVDTGSVANPDDSTGERWYELRPDGGGALSEFQEGTHAPNTTFRWMGSVAMDQVGDMALGYSVSSTSVYPGVRYTGRLASDPLGQMEVEKDLKVPTGYAIGNLGGSTGPYRWGDYSEMSVDPVDDCTFWYANEFVQGTPQTGDWLTQLGSFKFPSCRSSSNDFSIAAAPANLSIGQGTSGTVAVSTSITNGSAEPVTLSASGMPSGVTAAFVPTSINSGGTSTLTLTASSSAAPGLSSITITGTGAIVTRSTTVNITVTAVNDFSISASPASVVMKQGQSKAVTVSTAITNGASVPVSLSASGLPSGVSASFAQNTISSGQSTILTFAASSSAALGSASVSVTGANGVITHSAFVNLSVVTPLSFTQQMRLNPNSANQIILVQKDSEPTMSAGEDGAVYVNAPIGGGGGCHAWSINKVGPASTYLGQSDAGIGGGDCDIAQSRSKDTTINPTQDLIAATSLGAAGNEIYSSSSVDGGHTWVTNPGGTQNPADDRMWMSPGQKDKPEEFFMTYRQAPGSGFYVVAKSEDGGVNFTITGAPVNNIGSPTSNFTSWEGPIVVDPNNSQNLYVIFLGSPATNRATLTQSQVVWLGSSHDGGTSWTETVIHDGGAGRSYGHIFPSMAMDQAGRMFATYTDGTNVFLASSPASGLPDSGSWAEQTIPTATLNGSAVQTTKFPWISASKPGQADVIWYGSSDLTQNANSPWGLFFSRATNGTPAPPTQANSGPFHAGWICDSGTACANVSSNGISNSGDRRLGDFMTIKDDPNGVANIVFTHDPDCPCGASGQPDGRGSYVEYVREIPTDLDHITLSPASKTVTAGAGQPYVVEGFNHFGDDLGDVTAASTLAIAPDGACNGNICTATKAGTHTITASDSGKTATATLTINPGPATSLTIAPANASTTAGAPVTYTAVAFDQYSNSLGDVTASTSFTINNSGTCNVNSCGSTHAGSYTVTATDGAASASTSLTITPGPLAALALAPANATIGLSQTQSYTATGTDQFGNSIGDVTSSTTFTIAPDGSCTGATCKGTAFGNHTVTGSRGAATGSANLTISDVVVDHITISPTSSSIVAGGSQTYTVLGYDSSNALIGDVTTTTVFTILPNGSCSSATCSATIAGSHTVTASRDHKTAVATLTVTPGPATKLGLNPAASSIPSGDTRRYTAQGLDQYGNPTGDLTSATTFTIAPDGACTGVACTATVVGPHTVTGTDGTLTGQATLDVVPIAPVIISPAEGALTPAAVTVAGTAGPGQVITVFDRFFTVANGVVADNAGHWSVALSFANGQHRLVAKATEGSETSAASSVRTFTVDAAGPTVHIFTPLGGTSFLSFYLPGDRTLRGSATDNTGVKNVVLTYKNVLTGAVVKTTNASCPDCPSPSLIFTDPLTTGPGIYQVTAVATDLVGNNSPAVTQTFFSFGI